MPDSEGWTSANNSSLIPLGSLAPQQSEFTKFRVAQAESALNTTFLGVDPQKTPVFSVGSDWYKTPSFPTGGVDIPFGSSGPINPSGTTKKKPGFKNGVAVFTELASNAVALYAQYKAAKASGEVPTTSGANNSPAPTQDTGTSPFKVYDPSLLIVPTPGTTPTPAASSNMWIWILIAIVAIVAISEE